MDEEIIILFPFVLVAGVVFVIVVNIVMQSIVKLFCHSRDVTLKIRMVDAGMPADEIERIVLAGRPPRRPQHHAERMRPAKATV